MNHQTAEERTIDPEDRAPTVHGKWASALVALLGLWLGTLAVLGDASGLQFWNDLAVGALLTVAGGSNFVRRWHGRPGSYGPAVVAVGAGMWLVAAQFVFEVLSGSTGGTIEFGIWNGVFVGMFVAILGAYSAYEASRDRDRGAGSGGR